MRLIFNFAHRRQDIRTFSFIWKRQPDGSILITLTVDGKAADIRGLFFDINNPRADQQIVG